MIFLILMSISWSRVTADDNSIVSPSNKYLNLSRRFLPLLCPGADVCLDNRTIIMEGIFKPGKTSCCTECSCNQDCIKTNNCCFPSKETPVSEQTKSVCLYPMDPQPYESSRRIQFNSYKMVSSVPKTEESSHTFKHECGDEKVAPWGSLLPVYSKETQMIYKNPVCAQAAGILKGTIWNVLISCKLKWSEFETNDASAIMLGLHTEYWSNGCDVYFLYPGEYSDIEPLLCFEDLISTCPPIIFEKPTILQQLSRKEIRDACTSGLVAPYLENDLYANVFCYICNGHMLDPMSICSIRRDSTQKMIAGHFVGLIDSGSFFTASKDEVIEEHVSKQAFYLNNENEQVTKRRIHCPSGRIFDKNGECIFPVTTWFVDSIAVCIKLTSDTFFNINDVFKISSSGKSNISALYNQWPEYWLILSLSFDFLNTSNHESLTIQMVNKRPSRDPNKILKNIKTCLELPWTLKVNDTLLPMTAKLVHMLAPYHGSLTDDPLEEKDGVQIKVPKYVYIYEMLTQQTPLFITSLYYNELIELKHSEFELIDQHKVLLDKISNKTFLLGDFTLIQNSDGLNQARISLRFSGFSKEMHDDSTACKTDVRILAFMWICFTLLSNI